MRNFPCPTCGSRLYFENSVCTVCGSEVAFDVSTLSMQLASGDERNGTRLCANADHCACNWLTSAPDTPYCLSCGLNRTIPPIQDPVQKTRWAEVERAKRRLVYDLRRLSLAPLPIASAATGLTFKILVDAEHGGEGKVVMGHESGLITIDAAEADAPRRERRRERLGEDYRTMLGHMRHESGHYFWERLAASGGFLGAFRSQFGDERADYGDALARYYENGAPQDWQSGHVSAYATSHPWEDWAETFAHYLHMIDGLETFGHAPGALPVAATAIPAPGQAFSAAIDAWVDISIFMNSMSRSLGHQDSYPFVFGPPFRAKLAFVHEWLGILASGGENPSGQSSS